MRQAVTVISDLDIWRAANLLIRQHGDDGELAAAQRADLMRAALMGGRLDLRSKLDRGGKNLWKRIRRAIVELQALPTGRNDAGRGCV